MSLFVSIPTALIGKLSGMSIYLFIVKVLYVLDFELCLTFCSWAIQPSLGLFLAASIQANEMV